MNELNTNQQPMTSIEAYKAMIEFLERYWKLTQSDEIAGLLGSMTLLDDGTTADGAILGEWLKCCEAVLQQEAHQGTLGRINRSV